MRLGSLQRVTGARGVLSSRITARWSKPSPMRLLVNSGRSAVRERNGNASHGRLASHIGRNLKSPEYQMSEDEEAAEEQNQTLIAEHGERSIYKFEIRKPDGIWLTMYRGQDKNSSPGGGETDAPAHPTFPDEEQAREWLDARKP